MSSNTEIKKQINEYKEKLVTKGIYGNNFDILSLCGSIARQILLYEQDVSYVSNKKIKPVSHKEFLKLIKLIELCIKKILKHMVYLMSISINN